MAYYVHRKVRGIWSWTDMMLTDSIREWIDTVRRLGFSINFNQVLNAIETIGNAIVTKIYAGKTKEQRNKEFFEDFYGDGTTSEPSQNPALQELANFAQQFGVDPQGIEDNLRNIYRALAKQLHPDMYPDPKKKSEMEQKFKELQIIWNKIPDQYKQAFSWYELYKFANC
jgi:hypothetical protein